jgi:AcrR family transcriptional regulator
MPRARSLSTDAIAEAALAVIDDDGLAALSMRTVAGRLGVGAMSLYRYVSDRAELELWVVDAVLAGVDVRPPRGSAAHRLAVLADRVRSAVAGHPGVIPLLLIHRHHAPATLRWGEAVLRVLTDAGLDGERRVVAFRAVVAQVFGALEVAHHSPLSGAGTVALTQLPPERFPLLTATAADAAQVSAEAEFRRGVDIVIRGLDL